MPKRRYRIPSTSALMAFESAARHCNFSRAAEELNTSQPAISRHVADIEGRLNTRLFGRERRRLRLTQAGAQYYRAVVAGLDGIHAAGLAIEREQQADVVTIACTHEISHLILMPRYETLQEALGEDIQIRIMTCEYDTLLDAPDPRIDLMFVYSPHPDDGDDCATIFQEAVVPVASPAFVTQHALQADGDLSGLPFLKLTKQNYGWATWNDWFERRGGPDQSPRYISFDNYVYLLEAAAAGRGLALGWRGLIERHLENGTLVALTTGDERFERALQARLSASGRQRELARRCLALLRKTRPDLTRDQAAMQPEGKTPN